MKTLLIDDISLYLIQPNEEIILGAEQSEKYIDNELLYIMADITQDNAQIVDCIEPPVDWVGNKYLYQNNIWELNPSYVEPTTTE